MLVRTIARPIARGTGASLSGGGSYGSALLAFVPGPDPASPSSQSIEATWLDELPLQVDPYYNVNEAAWFDQLPLQVQ